MQKVQKLKGFPDYEFPEQLLRNQLLATIARVYESYGFLPMSTPALEYKEVLTGKYGEDEKLLYSFTDKGGREVAMRYDLTVPLARFVAERKGSLTWPFKRYQIGPVWRADNTQRGRLREFYQCDVDTLGSLEGLADAEVMLATSEALSAMGAGEVTVLVNDRRVFAAVFAEDESSTVLRAIDKLDKEGESGVVEYLEKNKVAPEVISKVKTYVRLGTGRDALQKLLAEYPKAKEAANNLSTLLLTLEGAKLPGVKFVYSPSVVRGLEYYTAYVFELVVDLAAGFGSFGGGGRYDGLLENLGGGKVSAVGGSIGFDRVFEYLREKGPLPALAPVQLLVVNFADVLPAWYLDMSARLRKSGMTVEVFPEPAKLEKQFKYAEQKGIGWALLVGQQELEQGKAVLRNLATHEQETLELDQAVEEVVAKILQE